MMNAYIIRRGLIPTVVGAVALWLAACGEGSGPQQPALTRAQADSLGEVVVADAQADLDVATAEGGPGFVPGASPGLPLQLSPQFCQPTIEPVRATNSDGDRVRDSVRLTFSDCVISFRHGSDTVRGLIDIVDPTPSVTDRSIKLAFTDFARIHVDRAGLMSSITQNGSRQLIRDVDHIAQSTVDFHTAYVFHDGTTASHVRDWDLLFTADLAGAIRADSWLPSGALTVTGTSTFTHGDKSFALDVSTPTSLHFDATCEDRPKFDSGTLIVIATRNGTTSTVTIDFTACGQYTVTKS